MQIFGFTITRTKSLPQQMQLVDQSRGGWWPVIREPYTGAWQANSSTSADTVLTYSALYACVSLMASDVAKCRLKLVERDDDGIWSEVTKQSPYLPVIRKPNHFQNRIQFYQWWMSSKLLHGNTYVLKRRDNRGVVTGLYILDPTRVVVLVAPDGSVFYQLTTDQLASLPETVTVPAREMIHDVMVPLFHPLIGVTPIYACGMAAFQGIKIQTNSTKFFSNFSQPSGVLTAPGVIAQTTADRMKTYWETEFGGDNVGKVAVLGDGLKFEPMTVKAVDAQLIEQLKWTGLDVCSAFHVPAHKVGVGPAPPYNQVEALNQDYYSQCIQIHFESIELLLDEGLELGTSPRSFQYGTEFDIDDLIRMDSATKMDVAAKGVGAGIFSPDEARAKFDRSPVPGGNTPYMQEQNWPLRLLAARNLPARQPTEPANIGEGPGEGEQPGPEDETRSAEWNTKAAAMGLM